jgi:N-ethylmaleimide reductase
VRLSPYGKFSDMGDSNPQALFTYVLEQLSQRGIAYAHVIEPRAVATSTTNDDTRPRTAPAFRKAFQGAFISAGGYTAETAEEAIADGDADAVAFGRLFLANPDLPERFREGADLNTPNRQTFYGGAEVGYTDYPSLQEVTL